MSEEEQIPSGGSGGERRASDARRSSEDGRRASAAEERRASAAEERRLSAADDRRASAAMDRRTSGAADERRESSARRDSTRRESVRRESVAAGGSEWVPAVSPCIYFSPILLLHLPRPVACRQARFPFECQLHLLGNSGWFLFYLVINLDSFPYCPKFATCTCTCDLFNAEAMQRFCLGFCVSLSLGYHRAKAGL